MSAMALLLPAAQMSTMALLLGGPLLLSAASAADAPACHIFPGATYGMGQIATGAAADAGECCAQCTASPLCQAWTFHKKPSAADPEKNCYLKDNVKPESPPRKIDPHNNPLSGLTAGPTCTPHASVCASGEPCPVCGAPKSAYVKSVNEAGEVEWFHNDEHHLEDIML